MVTKVYEMRVLASVEKVWEFHNSLEALKILTPSDQELRVVGRDVAVREGALHQLEFKQFGLKQKWNARITGVREPYEFTDTAEKSPFKYWSHRHEFIPDEDGTIIRDTVTYQAPGWILSGLVNALVVEEKVDTLFKFRHKATKQFLEVQPASVNEELMSHSADEAAPESL